jgi:outer membrane protein TolC
MTCRQFALEHQPAIRAAQLSLAAAEDRAAALDKLHTFLARDLPVRRQQAGLGLTIARAGVLAAEGDAIYGVTYSYLAAVYATELLKVADDAKKSLNDMLVLYNDALRKGARKDIFVSVPETNGNPRVGGHKDAIDTYLAIVEARRQQAVEGRERALAALREALGDMDVAGKLPSTLPVISASLEQEQVIALAVARRGELIQATTLAHVVALEADAQAASHLPTARTFAAGSDIHVRPAPTGTYGLEYVPGSVAPEMPTQLVGCKADRIQQAHDYAARAEAVAAKTRNLVVLEAENAYRRWREKSTEAKKLDKAAVDADYYARRLREKFDLEREKYPHLDNVLQSGITASRLRVDALEARFQALLALAMLERVTAGGLCLDFDAGRVSNAEVPEQQPGTSP